jgi:hypothetical protein
LGTLIMLILRMITDFYVVVKFYTQPLSCCQASLLLTFQLN